jgi:hypothetical protein
MLSSAELKEDFVAAAPHLANALERAGNTHHLNDVYGMLLSGEAALFVGDRSAVVTQEIEIPAGRQLHFWLAGGDLDELVRIEGAVETAAREKGIHRFSIVGRRGWRKKLPGYRESGVIFTKEDKQ